MNMNWDLLIFLEVQKECLKEETQRGDMKSAEVTQRIIDDIASMLKTTKTTLTRTGCDGIMQVQGE